MEKHTAQDTNTINENLTFCNKNDTIKLNDDIANNPRSIPEIDSKPMQQKDKD